MRIMMSSPHYRNINSGAAGTVERIGFQLRELGNDVDFVFWEDVIHKHKNPNISAMFDFPKELYKASRKKDYDIIDVRGYTGYYLGKRKRTAKYIFRNGGLDSRYWNRYFKEQIKLGLEKISFKFKLGMSRVSYLEKKAIKVCDGIILMSNQDKDYIEEELGIREKEIKVIPGGIENIPRENKPIKDRAGDIICIGWWGYGKGFTYILESLTSLLKTQPGLNITFLGVERNQLDQATLGKYPFLETIRIPGLISNKEVMAELSGHKILLNPTLFEGFGKTFVEGMAAGCCVVGTRVGAGLDFIEDGVTGVFVKRRDSDDIVDKIRNLFNNPVLMQSISGAAFKKVQDLTWEQVAEKTLEFYNYILSKKD